MTELVDRGGQDDAYTRLLRSDEFWVTGGGYACRGVLETNHPCDIDAVLGRPVIIGDVAVEDAAYAVVIERSSDGTATVQYANPDELTS